MKLNDSRVIAIDDDPAAPKSFLRHQRQVITVSEREKKTLTKRSIAGLIFDNERCGWRDRIGLVSLEG